MSNLPVKPFQETLYSDMCGPASLKMVLDYYGVEKTEKELAELTGMVSGFGVDEDGIRRAAESLGFQVDIKNECNFDNISNWLEKGVPMIIDWFTRGRADYPDSEVADGHYSVVVGLDDKNIYIQDPEIGSLRTIARDDFYRVWFDFKGEHITDWNEMIVRQIIAIYK
jgi:hypothetical protein